MTASDPARQRAEQTAEECLRSVGYTCLSTFGDRSLTIGWRKEDYEKLRQVITNALRAVEAATWGAAIKEAVDAGYLTHTQACRKGFDSETCTCGIMKWLPGFVGRRRAAGGTP